MADILKEILRGIGYLSPVTWVQLATGHRQAAKRSADFLGPAAVTLLSAVGGGGSGGLTRGSTGGVSLSDTLRSSGLGAGSGLGFSPGSAAAQEGMGLGGLFGQEIGGTPTPSAGGGIFNMGNISNLQNLMQSGTGPGQAQSSSLRSQMILDTAQRKQEEEQAIMLAGLIDELLKTRVPRRLR